MNRRNQLPSGEDDQLQASGGEREMQDRDTSESNNAPPAPQQGQDTTAENASAERPPPAPEAAARASLHHHVDPSLSHQRSSQQQQQQINAGNSQSLLRQQAGSQASPMLVSVASGNSSLGSGSLGGSVGHFPPGRLSGFGSARLRLELSSSNSAPERDIENEHSDSGAIASSGWSEVELSHEPDGTPGGGVPPSARSLHAAALLNGTMYVFGGYDGSQRVNTFHAFSFAEKRWSPVLPSANSAPPPSPRDRHVAVAFGNSIFIHGGFDGTCKCF